MEKKQPKSQNTQGSEIEQYMELLAISTRGNGKICVSNTINTILYVLVVGCLKTLVARRNDDAIADALRMLVGSLGQIPQVNVGNRNGDDGEFQSLGKFQRNNPPIFEGEQEPDKAQKEAEDWWGNTAQRCEEEGIQITWDLFYDAFLETYFLEDFCGKKEVEFLELKQGNGTVAEYAAKFQELIKYCPHYNTMNGERSKCLKFVNDLRHDIKKAIGYQQITHFAELVYNSRIYDKDSRESGSHYKALNDGKGKGQYRGKPYVDKKKKAGYGGKPSGGGSSSSVKCFKCGVEGHRANECNKNFVKCFKCDKLGHKAVDCKVSLGVTCYNYGEQGHISTKCDKPKKEQAKGKVFALYGDKATADDRLILGTSMIIDIPAMGSMSTSFVFLNCPLSIFGREFGIDLVFLPLEQLNVILGINWLEFNRVYINRFEKTIIFP
ncbi:uncharacterized protein LOC131641421 [Vicia villosa]|uniref:uncharacterized protein LOC131641421 n=1 Tax=Vicia villosa TaxID=3911 RepID=UPI00273B3370|nr:uncharacterized protein LOC131641421 [Vicia villosa]